jgi:hypothetical protein
VPERIVEVTIDKDGNPSIDLKGFHGKGCKDIAKSFDKFGKIENEHIKPEIDEATTHATVKVGS